MAKMLKLAIAPDNRVVYRETGRVIRGDVTTKMHKNGRIGVYRRGRLIGYASKPTKTQQARINKLTTTRAKRTERKAVKDVVDYAGDMTSTEPGGWAGSTELKTIYDTFPVPEYNDKGQFVRMNWITPLTRDQRGQINYGSYLQQMVERGTYTVEEANDLWDEYVNGNDGVRNQLWDDAHKKDEEVGYKYLNARGTELKKALRAMGFDFSSLKG